MSQCANTISTFPYVEDFENNNGGWVSGGIADDWGWGAPDKPVITAAGSGNKCWIIGGPNISEYNVNERSYLLTPCFDFSNINNPLAAFKVFWETENGYDGSNFQYTLDNGDTWVNVGATGQQNECFVKNWYNNANISNMTNLANPKAGWSGNIQTTGSSACGLGDGSGEWKLATYCLDMVAGQPEVQFRFTFGAGSICNEYDGFALDSFSISEAYSLFDAFSINTGNCDNSMEAAVIPLVPDACFGTLDWNWDFGDGNDSPAVGYTSHTYSNSGTYQVILSVSGNCFSQNITQSVDIVESPALELASTISNCGQNNGTATVVSSGGITPLSYNWSTNPPQTFATAINLAAGDYTVTVTFANNCTTAETVTVLSDVDIPDIQVAASLSITCTNPMITLVGNSTTPNVGYSWSGPGGFSANIPNPSVAIEGIYTLVVTDLNTGCATFANTTVVLDNIPPTVNAGTDQVLSCMTGTAILQGESSSLDANIQWVGPSGFVGTGLLTNTSVPGNYILSVEDTLTGCSNQDEVTVEAYTPILFYLNDTICETTCIDFNGFCLDQAGIYADTLLAANGCDSFLFLVLNVVHCPWLDQACYIPNVFSPNNDGLNDKFKAEGINFDTYEMRIFDRWGNYIYQSNDAGTGWDGTYRDKPADIGVYAYYVVIKFINGNIIERKGDVLLVR